MELARINGTWSIQKLNSYPFELNATCEMNDDFTFTIYADDNRLELFTESDDRRYPMTPAVNYVIDDEVQEDDLVQLLKDIRITVAKIQGSLQESYDDTNFRNELVRTVDTFVDSANN